MRFTVINLKKAREKHIHLLPDKGLFKIPDTKTYTLEKEILQYDAESFLTATSVGEVLGIEWLITKDKCQGYIFTSAKNELVLPLKEAMRPFISTVDHKDMDCFTLSNNKSSCFPFSMTCGANVFEFIQRYTVKSLSGGEKILIQLLLRKRDDWQDELRQQYHDYLQGIELPTNNKLIRHLQFKILGFVQTKDEWIGKNPEIDSATQKFREDGFQVCLRVAVHGGNEKSRSLLAQRVKLGFSHLNYVNNWIMSKQRNRQQFLEEIQLRRFPLFGKQIMSISEILPFFGHQPEMKTISDNEVDVRTDEGKYESESPPTIVAASAFDLFPTGEKLQREDDVDINQKLNKTFKKLKLINSHGIVVQNVQQGATVKKVNFNLPDGLTLMDLRQAIKNIQAEMALKDIGFEQGKEAGTVNMIIPQEKREKVFIRDCAETKEFQVFVKKALLPFLLGANSNGEIVYEDLVRIKHLLVAGTTGSGKSVFLNTLLVMLLLLRSPKELQMLLIDPKQVELSLYKKYPHVIDVITDNEEACNALKKIVAKMEQRYEVLAKKGYKNIQQYNKNEKEKLPYIVVVIDELADLIMTFKNVEEPIVLLAQKARAAGIHLIICTQKPLREIVTSLIKGNIFSRVCFLCDGQTSYRVALDQVPEFQLLGNGDGVYRFEGIQGLNRFQGALIGKDEDEQDRIIERLSTYWKGDFRKESLDEFPEQETELDKLKKIIAETGETRMKELQGILKINMNRLKEHFDELVQDGWLRNSGIRSKGYELLLTQEDRVNYLRGELKK